MLKILEQSNSQHCPLISLRLPSELERLGSCMCIHSSTIGPRDSQGNTTQFTQDSHISKKMSCLRQDSNHNILHSRQMLYQLSSLESHIQSINLVISSQTVVIIYVVNSKERRLMSKNFSVGKFQIIGKTLIYPRVQYIMSYYKVQVYIKLRHNFNVVHVPQHHYTVVV